MQKLPENVHRLRGFPGKRRPKPEITPEIPKKAPEPPSFLSPTAAQEWARVAPELTRLGLLSVLDMQPFAAYCESFATWRIATEAAADVMAPVDEARVLLRIAREAAKDMLRIAKAFGLTPNARASVAGASAQGGKFDGLLGA